MNVTIRRRKERKKESTSSSRALSWRFNERREAICSANSFHRQLSGFPLAKTSAAAWQANTNWLFDNSIADSNSWSPSRPQMVGQKFCSNLKNLASKLTLVCHWRGKAFTWGYFEAGKCKSLTQAAWEKVNWNKAMRRTLVALSLLLLLLLLLLAVIFTARRRKHRTKRVSLDRLTNGLSRTHRGCLAALPARRSLRRSGAANLSSAGKKEQLEAGIKLWHSDQSIDRRRLATLRIELERATSTARPHWPRWRIGGCDAAGRS